MMASSSREKERLLQPVYNALERRNYNRAIKLCSEKQISAWPIAIGLRAHALERSGRSDEAIRTLEEELLPKNDWEQCESTIAIMAMTLKSCRHYDTLAQMYSRAVETGERQRSPLSPDLRALHHNNLVGLFTAHLRLALQISKQQQPQQQNLRESWMNLTLNLSPTQIHLTTSDITISKTITSRQRDSIQLIANCYEAMQAAAMKLARGFGGNSSNIDDGMVNVYWSWTVFSILLHCEALQHLLLLQTVRSSSPEQIHLLRQKSEMLLPKLAENLFQTKLLPNKSYVSGEEWKLYIRSLLAQSKYSDALKVLEHELTPFPNDNSCSNTIFQMSDRERMVLLIKVSFLAKEFATSMQYCIRQLTEDPQRQWSCFMALLTNNISMHHHEGNQYEINWKECEELLQMESGMDSSAPLSDLNMHAKIHNESNERRSKSLFRIQLAATKLSHSSSSSPSLLLQFQNSILDYIRDFALDASCVFLDMKPFLKFWSTDNAILAFFATPGNEHHGENFLKNICSLRLKDEDQHQQQGETIEPNRFLRRYTTVCQIICFLEQSFLALSADEETNNEIEKKVGADFLKVIEQHGPKIEEMLKEWKNRSLSTTALVYKEGRIGDEIVLCVARTLVRQALLSSFSRHHCIQLLLTAVGILEHALIQSPYCSSVALMLIQLHNLLGSSFRSLHLFSSLDIKQVQVESMSHLILSSCSSAGAFGEMSKRCGEILQLHRSAANSVCDYAMEALQKGNYTAAIDMIQFQTQKMNPSVQLLHAKAMIMDLAPLLAFHRNPTSGTTTSAKQMPIHLIGSIHGIVGDDTTDETRALEMLAHSSDRHSATSIILECLEVVEDCVTASVDGAYSDNRDLQVCSLDLSPIISTAEHLLDIARLACFPSKRELIFSSLSVGHVHSILVRTTVAISAIKPFMNRKKKSTSQSNRKNSVKSSTTKESSIDTTVAKQHIQSLHQALEGAKTFFSCICMRNSFSVVSESAAVSNALLRAFLYLSEFVLTTCEWTIDNTSSTPAGNPNVCHLIQQAREQIDASISSLMLHSNMSLDEGRIFLIDPMNLNTIGNLIPQRLVALFATLHNLKRILFSIGHKISSSKLPAIDFECAYKGLISSCIHFVNLLDKALACESSEIEALSGSNFLSCVSSNDDLTEFLQTSYVTAASLVSNYQDESRRVIKSILAEFSICCLELQV